MLLPSALEKQGANKVTAEVAIDSLPSNRLLQEFVFTVEKNGSFQKYNMDVRFDSYLYAKMLNP